MRIEERLKVWARLPPDQDGRDGLDSVHRCPLRFIQGVPLMMPSNSTAMIESQGDLERCVEGAGAMALDTRIQPKVQLSIMGRFPIYGQAEGVKTRSATPDSTNNGNFCPKTTISYKRWL